MKGKIKDEKEEGLLFIFVFEEIDNEEEDVEEAFCDSLDEFPTVAGDGGDPTVENKSG